MRTGGNTAAWTIRRILPPAEVLALTALLALFVVKGLVPGWESLRSDFANYFVVARLLREHYAMDRIYDWIWLQRVKDHWAIPQPLIGFAGLTPFSALPMVPLTWLDALEAKRVWLAANLGIVAAVLFGLHRLTSLGIRRVELIAFLAIIPMRNNFLLGQMHLVVLGLLVLAYWLHTRRMWFCCGLALAVAASLKVYPLFFVFYFLRKREWKPAAVLAGATLAIFAACFLFFGAPVMRVFLMEQFPRMLRGEATDPFSLTAPSASGFFHRIFLSQPQVNPQPLLQSPLLYAMLYPLWQLGLLSAIMLTISPNPGDARRRGLEWAAWICLLLALSTEPASYHRVVLVLVAALAINAIDGLWRRAILLGCYFVACNAHLAVSSRHLSLALLGDFLPFWATVAMFLCLMAALRARPLNEPAARPPWRPVRAAWAVGIFVAIWGAASAITYAHAATLGSAPFASEHENASYARYDPHPAGGNLLTIAMAHDGYRVENQDGERYRTATGGIEDDQLAIAANPSGSQFWVEAANAGQSRLLELPVRSGAQALEPLASIFDAESPALAPDGSSLAFLREAKGVGSAWLVHLDKSGSVLTPPEPISPAGMDVRSVAFAAPDTVMLAAAEHGVSHLFVTLRGGPPRRVFAEADAMAEPAAQAENGVLVRKQWMGGYWRLMASSSLARDSVQLTFGDCNAYDPAWRDRNTLVYISDCGRGMGLGALAEIDGVKTPPGESKNATPFALSRNRPQGEPQR